MPPRCMAAFFKGRLALTILDADGKFHTLESLFCRLGGGHAQVAVLRQFAMSPLPGLRLALVTPGRTAYSGMLPGFVEGKWSDQDLHIDLARLAQMANARLILDRATGIDASARQLHFAASHPSPLICFRSISAASQISKQLRARGIHSGQADQSVSTAA